MLKWFGSEFEAWVYRDCPRVDTPVGAVCVLCETTIKADDDGFIDAGGSIEHRRCLLSALGFEGLGDLASRTVGH